MNYRPLGYVMEILDSVGLPVSYSYDDLVFVENNSLLVRFNDEEAKQMFFYFNKDLDKAVASSLEPLLLEAAYEKGYTFINSGHYDLREKDAENEELEVRFLN